MSENEETDGPRLDSAQAAMRDHFLGWQCRIRQHAVRHAGGRPTGGMRPAVRLSETGPDLARVTVLIVRREPEETTAQFRHIARKTQDPAERYDAALKFLAAAYYQRPREFSDELTALFAADSEIAERMLAKGRCLLKLEQTNQRYALPSRVRFLAEDEPAFQATYWHNALFNPTLPGGVRVLGLKPDWTRAEADPPVRC